MANEIHRTLPLGVKMREALGWIGTLAERGGKPVAAEACRALLKRLDDTAETTVQIQIVALLCHACDDFRARNDMPTVELLEVLLKALKDEPRLITGSFTFSPNSEADLERGFETMRSMLKK